MMARSHLQVYWICKISREFCRGFWVESDAEARMVQDNMLAHGFHFDFELCHPDETSTLR